MSLILDALKKSEQERRRDQGPDLQTIHQPLPVGTVTRSRNTGWLGVALVLVNCAALGIWWWQRGPQPPTKQETAAVTAIPAEEHAAAAPVHDSGPSQNPSTKNETAVKQAQEPAEFTRYAPGDAPTAAAPNTASASANIPVQEISELPDSVRNTLPAMTFSFHVYSADPLKRTIIINNRRLREGDAVDAGITLQEITEDGVIIAMSQHRIHIGVLGGW